MALLLQLPIPDSWLMTSANSGLKWLQRPGVPEHFIVCYSPILSSPTMNNLRADWLILNLKAKDWSHYGEHAIEKESGS
jgi:hypothetical protein